jgi:hypothetical protein
MNNDISTKYRDHVINYREEEDAWSCDAFSSGKGSDSLALAKRIDRLIDGDGSKKPDFKRVDVWMKAFGYVRSGWKKVTLTSKAEDGYFATDGKDRKKLRSYDQCYVDTPDNVAKIKSMQEAEEQRDALSERIANIEEQMAPFKP